MWNGVNKITWYGVAFSSFRMLVGAVSAIYLMEHGVSLLEIGLLKTLQAILIGLLDIPTAYLADRYSRKAAVVLSVLFGAAWLALTGVASSIEYFFIAEMFNAFSIALTSGAFISYLIDVARSENKNIEISLVIGRYQKYQFFAMGIAALVGSFVSSPDSPLVWYLAATLSLLLLIFASWFLPKDRGIDAFEKDRSLRKDVSQFIEVIQRGSSDLKLSATALILLMIFYQVLIQFWQPFSQLSFGDMTNSSVAYGVLFVFILWGQSLAGHIAAQSKSIARSFQFAIAISLICIAITALGLIVEPRLICVAIVLMFASNRLLTTLLHSVFHDALPAKLRAALDSTLSSAVRLILFVVMPTFGYLLEKAGGTAIVIFYGVTTSCLVIAWSKTIHTATKQ